MPLSTKPAVDPRLVHALAHAPGGRLVIDQEDMNLFEGWDKPWQGCPATRTPDGCLVIDGGDLERPPRRRRSPGRASIRSMVIAAEKAGKTVTSVTMPDGHVLHFGVEPAANDASKPWDEALIAKQRALDAKMH